jgi:hypothetical protein
MKKIVKKCKKRTKIDAKNARKRRQIVENGVDQVDLCLSFTKEIVTFRHDF